MSIIRIGLSETKHFAEGYDAIFGKKKAGRQKKPKATVKSGTPKKKKGKKN